MIVRHSYCLLHWKIISFYASQNSIFHFFLTKEALKDHLWILLHTGNEIEDKYQVMCDYNK